MLMPLSGSANLRLMASSRTFKHARILIVDDEPANVDMLKRLLEQSGYSRIETTCDPREAAALYVDMRPDLILLDLHMPHMDGFAVLDQLNDLVEASYLPMLMLKGDMAPEARREETGGTRLPARNPVQTKLRLSNRSSARSTARRRQFG